MSKVDKCFEGKPYVKTSSLIAEERKLIKSGKIPQYTVMAGGVGSQVNDNHKYIMARKGDKMKAIAKRYNLSEEELRRMNPSVKTDLLKQRTKIRIK